MGLYDRYILPRLTNWACGQNPIRRQRAKIVPRAHGDVVELGMGSGLNLPHYDAEKVRHVWGVEPSEGMRLQAREQLIEAPFDVELVNAGAEDIPLEDASADSVVITYTLCTIPDVESALAEVRRILKPNGDLLFCEHGLAPDASVARWQNRITPVWKHLAGGCHLNRDAPALLRDAGFEVEELEQIYLPGPRFANFNVWGRAVKKEAG